MMMEEEEVVVVVVGFFSAEQIPAANALSRAGRRQSAKARKEAEQSVLSSAQILGDMSHESSTATPAFNGSTSPS